MTQWIWINGELMPMTDARIGVEDRGFQFADGVYEVIRLYGGRAFAMDAHLARLERSCAGIHLAVPMSAETLAGEIRRLVERSGVGDGIVYLQLTRGEQARVHAIPAGLKPTLLFYAQPLALPPEPGTGDGLKLLAVEDERWKRCWVKSIALLPNVLAKTMAVEAGADEAVFVENGLASEGSTSNLFAVVGGKLITCPVGPKVLPGVTRAVVLECVESLGIPVDERPIPVETAIGADELFITSTTREIAWVAQWNEHRIGPGRCGPITLALHQAVRQRVAADILG